MLSIFRGYSATDFQNADQNSINFLKEFCGFEKDPSENIGNVQRFAEWLVSEASQMGWEVKDVSVKDLTGNIVYRFQFEYEYRTEEVRDGIFSKKTVTIEESKTSEKLRRFVNKALQNLYDSL